MSENEPVTESTKRSVSYRTLIVAVLLTAAVTAAGVLTVVCLTGSGFLAGDSGIFEQRGTFPAYAQSGENNFPHPYALPPNVTLEGGGPFDNVSVVEVTATGFEWKNNHYRNSKPVLTWVAKGVKATTIPTPKAALGESQKQ